MRLPFPERVTHQHMAFLGKTGAGKSSAMRVVGEHLLDKKRRVAIIDPKGDWWGLKSSADGKSAGYPVIMFGDFKEPRATDVPLNPQSGKHVAELIATGNRPCVLGFRGWMPGQLVKFWLDFAPTLFNANEGELYVGIDEVHNFAPKGKIMDPDSGKCLHWTNRIMSEGRGLGLTFFIASQRAQKVHNDTLDNCETLVAMRVAHPAARESIKDWIDGNGDPAKGKEVLATLAQLKRGEAWVWSPENDFGPERVQFPMFETFDSFAPPQLQKKVNQAGWSEIDLDQVKQKLAAVIAEAKANDPKELKTEVARLKHELAKKVIPVAPTKPVPIVDSLVVNRAVTRALKSRDIEWSRSVRDYQREIEKRANEATKELTSQIRSAQFTAPQDVNAMMPIDLGNPPPAVVTPTAPRPIPISAPAPRIRAAREQQGDVNLGRVHREAAGILAGYYPEPVKTSILAVMCGRTMGGSWSARLSELRTAGLLDDVAAGYVRATEKCAHEFAGTFQAPRSTEEVLSIWMPKLGSIHRAMLQVLVDRDGEALTKADLAQAVNATPGGSFSARLSELRSTGLISEPERGLVAANSEVLFLSNYQAREVLAR